MSEVQTPLNSVISLAHKTAQIAQPPTWIPSISKVHPVRKYGKGFKPLPNYNKVSSPPLRMGHLSNWVKVSRDTSGKITVAFPYDPSRISKIKTIEEHKWHPDKKHWSFPDSEGVLHKILKIFGQEQVHLDPALQLNLSPIILDKVREAVQVRHYSRRTEQTYTDWVKRFSHFYSNQNLLEMGEKEINAFLSHLAVNEHISASTQTQALCAIVFLYRYVLKWRIWWILEARYYSPSIRTAVYGRGRRKWFYEVL